MTIKKLNCRYPIPICIKKISSQIQNVKTKIVFIIKKNYFYEEALKNKSVNRDSDFELNEIRGSADKYPEFGNNTDT